MSFCPNCGSRIQTEDRFCTQCGADLEQFSVQPETEELKNTVAEPEQPVGREELPVGRPMKKKKAGRVILYLLFIAVIVVVGYKVYFLNKDKLAGILKGKQGSELQVIAPKIPAVASDNSKKDSALEVKQSEIDNYAKSASAPEQTSAKTQAAEPVKASKTVTVPVKTPQAPSKPAENKKTNTAAKAVPAKKIVVLYSNWNSKLPLINNPLIGKNKLTVSEPVMITKITTYHWNFGRGDQKGGEITLEGSETYGPFTTKSFAAGEDGTPNAKWIFEPGVLVKPGTYKIEMPKKTKKTWSYNVESEGKGFVIVEGYYTAN